MEPKYFCMIFLGGLYLVTSNAVGLFLSVSFLSKISGILNSIAILALGGYFGYIAYLKRQTKEYLYIYAGVGAIGIIGGIEMMIQSFKEDFYTKSWFLRFIAVLFMGGALQEAASLYYYIPIQRFGTGLIPIFNISEIQQMYIFLLTTLISVFIQAVAICPNFPESSHFGYMILRVFIACLFSLVVGGATGYFLNTRSENAGYITQADQPSTAIEQVVDVEAPQAN
ncbi:hypothetical protein TVAG_040040 [Trichomonas vaginalis G3]|uniref:Uncharacterized protein n=1 Tax=Trichomonas vaginalis (strain ATCC PRA-98 / G3) TaxID=412133 RepID=A2EQX8_TRIV3|nr:hypothetical protein TVAGG3_0693690 [Trichomonas vaginalis G3]EAY04952.1 hypothetical protein TVAG_040040 [Trichomonas vaginalis G3]KAI5508762.1 hypothetical protein TVAGG3_0693690 [Trichomonas vaginalis G3]|eukprot:XP_001317175.1 hypothetical protein [Trichomonas vaginalis G3]